MRYFILSMAFYFFICCPLAAQIDVDKIFNPFLIDGVIDTDWDRANSYKLENTLIGEISSPEDFSASFRAIWDGSNIYFLVEVNDEKKYNDSQNLYDDDAVEIYIDAGNEKNTEYDENDFLFVFRWNDENIYESKHGNTSGINFHMSDKVDGYVLEVKIPAETLGLSSFYTGQAIGLDVHVHDDDDGGGRDAKLAWYTDIDESWQNPSLFGEANFIQTRLTPEKAQKPSFSHQSGFYENPFSLVIFSEIAGAEIKYTLDGSNPLTSENALRTQPGVVISVDPESDEHRPVTPAVIVRAVTTHPDYITSNIISSTYIFTNETRNQQYPGSIWPEYKLNTQYMDYEMDPDVVNNSRYTNLIESSLLDIPSISMITDPSNLFDADTGIYVNAERHGDEWERSVFVELLYPGDSIGYQIDCGMRIRGGWSRHGNFPKHAFRLFFRSEYGEAKLRYPLFGNEGADEFDKMDIRTSMNYSWSGPDLEAGAYNTMNRDVFSRDLQREMGQPYTRSRYYHLYLNGCYWGLFQTQERSEARFAETYLGGNYEDYDVIKRISGDYYSQDIGATDGTTDSWEEVWEFCERGFQDNEDYFKLQGRYPDGRRNGNLENLVDIDNLIDYMIIIFYTGNFDAPVSKFMNGNKGPNNFFAIYNKHSYNGYKFFAHDNEHTLLADPITVGIGLYENRVNIGSIDGWQKMVVNEFERFHPQWLHFKLSDNVEYRLRFADHVYQHFYGNGILTENRAKDLFMDRANEISEAIIAESARWGDTRANPPRTKHDDWLPAVNQVVNDFISYRGDIVLDQLKEEGLYPSIDPPVFTVNGNTINDDYVLLSNGAQVRISNPNGLVGDIIYTLDGNDPRKVGGMLSEGAKDGDDEISVTVSNPIYINARVRHNNEWSAMATLKVYTNITNGFNDLKITEIHYHPLENENEDQKDFEFIEFKNTGTQCIDLTGAIISGGISYTFPNLILMPQEFVVLASDKPDFSYRYGFEAFGEFRGNLDNAGENFYLLNADSAIIKSFGYADNAPWPEFADGLGYSLVPKEINPKGNPLEYFYWRPSFNIHGSPGRDDILTAIDEVFASKDGSFSLSVYPNPATSQINLSLDSHEHQWLTIDLFDLQGRHIANLINETISEGRFNKQINLSNYELSNGIYFIKANIKTGFLVKKITLINGK